MKNTIRIALGLFLATAGGSMPLHAMKAEKKIAASVEHVDKEMSLLDQIVEQANIVVDGADQKARTEAKKELTKLMKSKDLDTKIKDAIKDDIAIVKSPTTKRELHAARIRLLNTYAKIDSQANVVEAIAQATTMVQNASPEELDAVIVEAKKMVEAAEEEQQGIIGRWYAKAKRMVTAPVNYIFGEENSKAKTAFYAAVGTAILAAGVYGVYKYTWSFDQEDKLSPTENKNVAFLQEDKGQISNIQTSNPLTINDFREAHRAFLLVDQEEFNLRRKYREAERGLRSPLTENESKKWENLIRERSLLLDKNEDIRNALSEQGILSSPRDYNKVKREVYDELHDQGLVFSIIDKGAAFKLRDERNSLYTEKSKIDAELRYLSEQEHLVEEGKRGSFTEEELAKIEDLETKKANIIENIYKIGDILKEKNWMQLID